MFFHIILIVVGWVLLGGVINFLFYNDVPNHLRGHDPSAKTVHIILNIATFIFLLKTIFS